MGLCPKPSRSPTAHWPGGLALSRNLLRRGVPQRSAGSESPLRYAGEARAPRKRGGTLRPENSMFFFYVVRA